MSSDRVQVFDSASKRIDLLKTEAFGMSSRLKELSLVVLGAMLVKSARASVLGSVVDDSLDAEIGEMVRLIRVGDMVRVGRWLSKRGVTVTGGDAIASVCRVLADERAVAEVEAELRQIPFAVSLEDREALRVRLERIAEALK